MAFGTLTLADLLSVRNASTVAQVGLDRTFEGVAMLMDAHNNIMREIYTDLAERTTDELRRYGGGDSMVMEDADETTVPRAQKVEAGATVGLPLNAAVVGVQWTEMWFRKHTVEELNAQIRAAQTADFLRIQRDLKRALFVATNYTHYDHLVRNIDLQVKRLVNADSAVIPVGPYGQSFDGATHTHYIARVAAFASTDLDALINTVREHYTSGDIRVYINQAQEAAVSAFTGFLSLNDPRIQGAIVLDQLRSGSLNPVDYYNREIGLYNGARVFVKPWIPENYLLCFNAQAPKPLLYRYDPDYGDGLMLVKEERQYPWEAKGWRRIFGIGAWNRVSAAALYVGGTTTYVSPTIN